MMNLYVFQEKCHGSSPSFTSFWSAQTPFVANFALQQLRLWVNTSPWFVDTDNAKWFDIPAERLHQIQTDYQREWYQLGLQLLSRKPFSFTDKRFASDNWSSPCLARWLHIIYSTPDI
ncbi:hypothetical protein ACFSVK_06105 [Azorhizophilus paspali]|uniref:hypothetical protein n=1 Tax=Azorhizophilus paspali TaxID=69963 RepID=UPI0036430165